ncbi:MAG TPA: LLM class flavin-dependent oxidoreductase, partial [Chloroflexota bacterium]
MDAMFGVNLSTAAGPEVDPAGDARLAEVLGFEFLQVTDHLNTRHGNFETWTLLSWVAAQTSRIELGPNVLGLPYRSPAVIAKMSESLDRLTGGRTTLGLGAGGADAEFAAFGLTVRSANEKVEALREAILIIRGLWKETTFSFAGRHFQTDEAQIEPKAERRIPIYIGAYGPRMLALVGELADGWSPSAAYAPLPRAIEMRERVREAAREAGRDPDSIVCQYNVAVMVDERMRSRNNSVVGSATEV